MIHPNPWRREPRCDAAAVVVAVLLGACNLTGGLEPGGSGKAYPGWQSTKAIVDLSGSSVQTVGSFAAQGETTNKDSEEISSCGEDADRMFFRSSDLEFWSVDTVEGIAEMASAEVPTFENATYSMIRVDVGGGMFTFVIDGQEISPQNSCGGRRGRGRLLLGYGRVRLQGRRGLVHDRTGAGNLLRLQREAGHELIPCSWYHAIVSARACSSGVGSVPKVSSKAELSTTQSISCW